MAGKKKAVRRGKRPKTPQEDNKLLEIAALKAELDANFAERTVLFSELGELTDAGDQADIQTILAGAAGVVQGTQAFADIAADLQDALNVYGERPESNKAALVVGLMFMVGAVPE